VSPRRVPVPGLTVVIAATASAEAVARALASLGGPPDPETLEVIVAAASDRIEPPPDLPAGVVWLAGGPGSGVPRLRRLGLDRARGEIVVFTEDSCVFAVGWAGAWLAAFADPRVLAATGPVVPVMGDRPIDRAVFFCEYAPFLPAADPRADAPTPARLAGNNFAVRLGVRTRIDGREVHETEVRQTFAACPGAATLARGAVAGHARRYYLAGSIHDRLRFGYDYGRRRASALPLALRPAGFAVGPVVLFAQAARLTLTVSRRRRHLGEFLETLPLTLALLTAWSVGEWLGWVRGALPAERGAPPVSRRRRERAARPPAPPTDRPWSTRPRYTAGRPPA